MADMEDPGALAQAYGAAAKAGDTEAMTDLHGRLLTAYQTQNKAASDPLSDENSSDAGRIAAGVGHGAKRLFEGTGNLVGLGHVFPSYFGNEHLKEDDAIAKPLLDTSEGKWGDVAGQVLATAPLGMGTGALSKALLAAKAAKLGGTGGAVLRAAVRPGIAAGENALQSAATADPDKQGDAAEGGAVTGAALSALGGVAGKVVRGLVGKSRATKALYDAAENEGHDVFVPISQGANPGPTKFVYQKVLPYALGAGEQMEAQSGKAKSVLRDVAAEQEAPIVDRGSGVPLKDSVTLGKTPQVTAANLKDQFTKEYEDKLNSHAFNVPEDFHDKIVASLQDAHPDIPETHANQIAAAIDKRMQEFSKDGVITGGNLKAAQVAARGDLGELLGSRTIDKRGIETGLRSYDDVVQDELDENKSILGDPKASKTDKAKAKVTVTDLENYQRLGSQYKGASAVIGAATSKAAAPVRGEFKFSDLAKRAAPGSAQQEFAQNAHEVFSQSPGGVSPAGRHALHTVEGLGAGGALWGAAAGHPLGLGLLAAGNLAATKAAQKGLYGDLGWQKTLAEAIRNNPKTAYSAGLAGRSAANASGQ